MTKTPSPTDWSVTIKVMLDDDGGAKSVRDWLREHGCRCPKGIEAQLSEYIRLVLISNSDWDKVGAGFVVTAVTLFQPEAKGDP